MRVWCYRVALHNLDTSNRDGAAQLSRTATRTATRTPQRCLCMRGALSFRHAKNAIPRPFYHKISTFPFALDSTYQSDKIEMGEEGRPQTATHSEIGDHSHQGLL